MIEPIKNALTGLTDKVYLFDAPPNPTMPYIVYAPDGANDFAAGGTHAEKATEGTIDLYTGSDSDPLITGIENALDALAATQTVAWRLNSIQYETEAGTPSSGYTGFIHFEWVFQIGGR
jgi:hypothetical protein